MNPVSVSGAQPQNPTSNSFEWPGKLRVHKHAFVLELLILFGAGVLAAVLHQTFRWPLRMPGYHGVEWLCLLMLARFYSARAGAGLIAGLGAATAAMVYAGSVGIDGKTAQMLTYIVQGCVLDAFIFKSRTKISAWLYVPVVGAVVHMLSPLVRNVFMSLGGGALNFGSLLNGMTYPLMTHALFGAVGSLIGLAIFLLVIKKK